MKAHLRPCVVLFALLTLLTGVAYPALITVIAQVVFYDQANGSVIMRDGKAVGSELIGQTFDDPSYFWGRPSATGPTAYNAAASSGSNLGPTNPALLDAIKARVEAIRAAHPDQTKSVPVDLVTASGSGLDPHISPAAAEYQVGRVAKVLAISEDKVRELIANNTDGRSFGLLGEPRVNLLRLNLSLDTEGAKQE
ncbi:MAG TPA: potassium-transporting ATPase subunit KdpC [Planctomycetaceae bacterium]|nr:potassium-transporting ATPase subunit KdpC [Planctomycetaceae bacterium]HQZ67485.1 potassium-transporting ATPase subunit KdpC [Planctomycetaceae bacterium]